MFKIKEVTIIRLEGHPDKIQFLINGPSPWPNLDKVEPGNYEPHLQIECSKGYAEQWLTAIGFDLSLVKIIP